MEQDNQSPKCRISAIDTPRPRAEDAVVARVEPGEASIPASRRHWQMPPWKDLRDILASGQWMSKKRRSWRMSKLTLSVRRAWVRATGQMDESSFHALRRMGSLRWAVRFVLEKDDGTN
jgi:hypothetical protein